MLKKYLNLFFSFCSLRNIQTFLYGMLGAFFSILIIQFVIQKPKQIATIDIPKIMQTFVNNENKANLPNEMIELEGKRFGKELENKMRAFAKINRLILMPKPAVIEGCPDYTDFFINEFFSKKTNKTN